MDGTKVGVRFYLTTILALAAGAAIGFFSTGMILDSGGVFVNILLGVCLGVLSAIGILFLAPGDTDSERAVGRYSFWPGLMLGATLAMGATEASKTAILFFSFSAVAGFAVILVVFLWMDLREKKEND